MTKHEETHKTTKKDADLAADQTRIAEENPTMPRPEREPEPEAPESKGK